MPPGNTRLGVIGGGQLGMMLVQAARDKSCYTMVYDPDENSPAGAICDEHFCAGYDNKTMLRTMARQCDAATIEFENIPVSVLKYFNQHSFLTPSPQALAIVQDRLSEKKFIRSLGIKTANFAAINKLKDLRAAWEELSPPLVIKTARLGYDGKGQRLVETLAQAEQAFAEARQQPCIAEEWLPLLREISVVLARDRHGKSHCFPTAENEHRHGILHRSSVPANISQRTDQQAKAISKQIAAGLNYCGVLCVEFFIGAGGQLLVNEIAPRTHNSGHYTLDACTSSQFDQQVNILCGTPLAKVRLIQPITMINLLGPLWNGEEKTWCELFPPAKVRLHWYGKKDARPNRKMGHFCVLGDSVEETIQNAEDIYQQLRRAMK